MQNQDQLRVKFKNLPFTIKNLNETFIKLKPKILVVHCHGRERKPTKSITGNSLEESYELILEKENGQAVFKTIKQLRSLIDEF